MLILLRDVLMVCFPTLRKVFDLTVLLSRKLSAMI